MKYYYSGSLSRCILHYTVGRSRLLSNEQKLRHSVASFWPLDIAELGDVISCLHAVGFPGVGNSACIHIQSKISNMSLPISSRMRYFSHFSVSQRGTIFYSKITTTTSCNSESEMTLLTVVKFPYLNINLMLSVAWDIFDVYDFSAVATNFEARLELATDISCRCV